MAALASNLSGLGLKCGVLEPIPGNRSSKLGKGTSTNMKSKVTRFTNKVDSDVDENEVCSWRQEHVDKLYISVPDGGAKDSFISMVEKMKLCADK